MTLLDPVLLKCLPERWIEDHITPPSDECIAKAEELATTIYEKCGRLRPDLVKPSCEEGVFIVYIVGDKCIEFEIYNDDLSIGYFLREAGQTVKLGELDKFDPTLVLSFFEE